MITRVATCTTLEMIPNRVFLPIDVATLVLAVGVSAAMVTTAGSKMGTCSKSDCVSSDRKRNHSNGNKADAYSFCGVKVDCRALSKSTEISLGAHSACSPLVRDEMRVSLRLRTNQWAAPDASRNFRWQKLQDPTARWKDEEHPGRLDPALESPRR